MHQRQVKGHDVVAITFTEDMKLEKSKLSGKQYQ